MRPQDARKLAKTEGRDEGEPTARAAYPASLVTDLTGHRTAALRLTLAHRPDVALAATVHALITASQNPYSPRSALQLAVKSRDLAGVVADTGECRAHAEMEAELACWNDRIPADPVALWTWCLRQDQTTLLDLLATFAAATLDAVSDRACGGSIAHAGQLAVALDLDMAVHWQPTARFMGRVSKSVMATALAEAGKDTAAADVALMKKPAAAAKAAQVLAGTGWLPPVLRRQEAVAVNDNGSVAPWEGDPAETDEEAA